MSEITVSRNLEILPAPDQGSAESFQRYVKGLTTTVVTSQGEADLKFRATFRVLKNSERNASHFSAFGRILKIEYSYKYVFLLMQARLGPRPFLKADGNSVECEIHAEFDGIGFTQSVTFVGLLTAYSFEGDGMITAEMSVREFTDTTAGQEAA